MQARSSPSQPRPVNSILNTLRGEHFRHTQNLRGARIYVSSLHTRNSPTLPVDLIRAGYSPESTLRHSTEDSNVPPRCPGPNAPRSWTIASDKDIHETSSWRAQALSLIFKRLPSYSESAVTQYIQPDSALAVPPLSLLCLRKALSATSLAEFVDDVVPYLPAHLRRDFIRYNAVRSPFSYARLSAIWEENGHADGEIIVVGPSATLPDEHFLSKSFSSNPSMHSWDSDENTHMPAALHSFILVSTRLSPSILLTLPPTVTHMALIHLAVPFALHRLPNVCPLLVILDLSYNDWLDGNSAESVLDRVDWGRWKQLRSLGLRGCHIPDNILGRVNKGRWDDVEIIYD